MLKPLQDRRRLVLEAPEKLESIAGDARLIRRVIQNLIGNALKFTDRAEGVISVGVETVAEGGARVSVTDNDPGIPLEYREKVFEKFCQVAACEQGHAYSTGLDLTFCKLAVEAYGNLIGLESDPGKGSTFWFELPR